MFENPFGARTYLVIDDYGDMRTTIKGLLRSLGASEIVSARNAREALPLLEQQPFDVVLCDYNLGPGKNGQQLLEEARYRKLLQLSAIFIMITAENTREMVMAAVEYEPDSYLSKPFNKELLRTRLEKLFQRKHDFAAINQAAQHKDFAQAIELLDQGIAGKPRNMSDLLKLKADFCLRAKRLDEAQQIYEQVLAARDIPWARLGLGKVQYARKQFVEADETFKHLIANFKTVTPAYDWLAKTQRALGFADEAQQTLQDALQLSPKAIKRQQALGELALQSGDAALAEHAFSQAVQLGQHSIYRHPAMYAGLAQAKSGQGDHAAALQIVDDMQHDFDDPTARFYAASTTASVQQAQGNSDAAREALAQAGQAFAKLGEHAPGDIALQMARTLARLGDSEQADSVLRRAIQNNHDSDEFLLQATDAYRDCGLGEDAENQVLKIRQGVVDMNNRGVKLIGAGNYPEAIALFTQAADGMANNLVINLNAARAMIMLMEKQGADRGVLGKTRKYVERSRRIAPDDPRLGAIMKRFQKLMNAPLAARS